MHHHYPPVSTYPAAGAPPPLIIARPFVCFRAYFSSSLKDLSSACFAVLVMCASGSSSANASPPPPIPPPPSPLLPRIPAEGYGFAARRSRISSKRWTWMHPTTYARRGKDYIRKSKPDVRLTYDSFYPFGSHVFKRAAMDGYGWVAPRLYRRSEAHEFSFVCVCVSSFSIGGGVARVTKVTVQQNGYMRHIGSKTQPGGAFFLTNWIDVSSLCQNHYTLKCGELYSYRTKPTFWVQIYLELSYELIFAVANYLTAHMPAGG